MSKCLSWTLWGPVLDTVNLVLHSVLKLNLRLETETLTTISKCIDVYKGVSHLRQAKLFNYNQIPGHIADQNWKAFIDLIQNTEKNQLAKNPVMTLSLWASFFSSLFFDTSLKVCENEAKAQAALNNTTLLATTKKLVTSDNALNHNCSKRS